MPDGGEKFGRSVDARLLCTAREDLCIVFVDPAIEAKAQALLALPTEEQPVASDPDSELLADAKWLRIANRTIEQGEKEVTLENLRRMLRSAYDVTLFDPTAQLAAAE